MICFPYVLLNCTEQTFVSFLTVTLPYLTTSVLWSFFLCSKLQSLSLFSSLFWTVSDSKHVTLCKFQVFILVFSLRVNNFNIWNLSVTALTCMMPDCAPYKCYVKTVFLFLLESLLLWANWFFFSSCSTRPLKKGNSDFCLTLKVYLLLQIVSYLYVHC